LLKVALNTINQTITSVVIELHISI
jgi:hypothetical protein